MYTSQPSEPGGLLADTGNCFCSVTALLTSAKQFKISPMAVTLETTCMKQQPTATMLVFSDTQAGFGYSSWRAGP